MDAVTRSYDAKIDGKKRITLRNARFEYYNVKEYEDGTILLEPRELTAPFSVSANTLAMMDSAMEATSRQESEMFPTEDVWAWMEAVASFVMDVFLAATSVRLEMMSMMWVFLAFISVPASFRDWVVS